MTTVGDEVTSIHSSREVEFPSFLLMFWIYKTTFANTKSIGVSRRAHTHIHTFPALQKSPTFDLVVCVAKHVLFQITLSWKVSLHLFAYFTVAKTRCKYFMEKFLSCFCLCFSSSSSSSICKHYYVALQRKIISTEFKTDSVVVTFFEEILFAANQNQQLLLFVMEGRSK